MKFPSLLPKHLQNLVLCTGKQRSYRGVDKEAVAEVRKATEGHRKCKVTCEMYSAISTNLFFPPYSKRSMLHKLLQKIKTEQK